MMRGSTSVIPPSSSRCGQDLDWRFASRTPADKDGPADSTCRRCRADESSTSLHHRRGQGPQVCSSSIRSRMPSVRRSSPTRTAFSCNNAAPAFRVQPGHPNCIAPASGRSHHHQACHQGRPRADAVRRDGRAVSAGRAGATCDQHASTMVATCRQAIDIERGLHYENDHQLEDGCPPISSRAEEAGIRPQHRLAARRVRRLERLGKRGTLTADRYATRTVARSV